MAEAKKAKEKKQQVAAAQAQLQASLEAKEVRLTPDPLATPSS